MHWIDPDHLPEITGIVDQFLVNKHGEADGFLLTDGEEVHVPPLSAAALRHPSALPQSELTWIAMPKLRRLFGRRRDGPGHRRGRSRSAPPCWFSD